MDRGEPRHVFVFAGSRRAAGVTTFRSCPTCARRQRAYAVVVVNGILALVVVAVLAGLTPAAYATPPDQTWIGGWYDDGDYDDVVVLATSTAGAASSSLIAQEPATLHVVGVIVPPALPSVPLRVPVLTSSRAPPPIVSAV